VCGGVTVGVSSCVGVAAGSNVSGVSIGIGVGVWVARAAVGDGACEGVSAGAAGVSATPRARFSSSSTNLAISILSGGGTSGVLLVSSRQYRTMSRATGVFSVSTTSLATSTTPSPLVTLNAVSTAPPKCAYLFSSRLLPLPSVQVIKLIVKRSAQPFLNG
jgi:hypothetical protein